MAKIKKQNSSKTNATKLHLENPISYSYAGLGILVFFMLVLFGKSLNHQFLNYDDVTYVVNNHQIRNFNLEALGDIFQTPVLGMYNPLTFVIFALEYSFWGLNPKYFHLVNLLLHILSTVTCYFFIKLLCNNKEIAMYTTVLFAIHPMHVSVVTWISQCKTSLYVFFYLLGLMSYIRYVRFEDKNFKNYIWVFLFNLLALLSKPSAVTFAPILLLLDYYLNRKKNWTLLIEKIPFFALSLLFGLLTLYTHESAGDPIFEAQLNYSLMEKLLIANYAICFYIEKLIAPFGLSLIYPYPPPGSDFGIGYYLTLPVIPLLLYWIYKAGEFRKDLIFGMLFFAIAVSVVLRLVPLGEFGMANNYSYLSYIGPFFILSKLFVRMKTNEIKISQPRRNLIFISLVFIFGIICFITSHRVGAYSNSASIMSDVIEKYPNYATAYSLRGLHKTEQGDFSGAIKDFDQMIKLKPKSFDGYMNRGNLYANTENFQKALIDFQECYRLQPDNAYAAYNLGLTYYSIGDTKNALAYLDTSLSLKPNFHEALYFRGQILVSRQDFSMGLKDLEKSKKLGNKDAIALLQSIQIGPKPKQ